MGDQGLQLPGCPRACSSARLGFGRHRSLIFGIGWWLLLANKAKMKWGLRFPWTDTGATQNWELLRMTTLEPHITEGPHTAFFPSLGSKSSTCAEVLAPSPQCA